MIEDLCWFSDFVKVIKDMYVWGVFFIGVMVVYGFYSVMFEVLIDKCCLFKYIWKVVDILLQICFIVVNFVYVICYSL